MKKIGFFFYIGDWIRDTRHADLETRGAWIDLICLLYENDGEITWPMDEIARYLGIESQACHALVTRMSRLNLCSVTLHSNGEVTLQSRRLLKEKKNRELARLRQKKWKERQQRHRQVTHESNAPVTPPLPSPSLYISYKTDKNQSRQSDAVSVDDLVESWNENFSGKLPAVQLPLSMSRTRKVQARLKEHSGLDFWSKVFTNIAESTFLLGLNGNSWRCTFDFLIANDSNCLKIAEGAYSGKNHGGK